MSKSDSLSQLSYHTSDHCLYGWDNEAWIQIGTLSASAFVGDGCNLTGISQPTLIRNGSGAPSNGLGANGDYYLDDNTGNVYKRAANTYSVVANIKGADGSDGADGANGATWRTGSGVPDNGTGVDGDLYYRTSNGSIYKRSSGTYSVIDTLGLLSGDAAGNIHMVTNDLAMNDGNGAGGGDILMDGGDIVIGSTNGTKIGTAANQLLAFHGASPIAQAAGAAQVAVATTGATNTAPYGYSEEQANAIVALVNEIRAVLVNLGLMKGAAP